MKLEENADVMVITDLCPLFADVLFSSLEESSAVQTALSKVMQL